MAHYLNSTVESVIGIVDGAGNLQSGIAANVGANLYNPLDVLDGALVVTEILATGMYRCDFTRANPGAWKVLWSCTDPVCSAVRIYDLRDDPGLIADQVWDEILALHGIAGSAAVIVKDILADTDEIQGKLPNNNIMGSSDKDDHDTTIDLINANVGQPTDLVAAGSLQGKIGANAVFAGHDSLKQEVIDLTLAVTKRRIQGL